MFSLERLVATKDNYINIITPSTNKQAEFFGAEPRRKFEPKTVPEAGSKPDLNPNFLSLTNYLACLLSI